jgi:hypothetical protein
MEKKGWLWGVMNHQRPLRCPMVKNPLLLSCVVVAAWRFPKDSNGHANAVEAASPAVCLINPRRVKASKGLSSTPNKNKLYRLPNNQ